MEKKNDKKFNWKKAAVIGGIFAAGVAVGVAGDKACIKLMVEKGYKTVLKGTGSGLSLLSPTRGRRRSSSPLRISSPAKRLVPLGRLRMPRKSAKPSSSMQRRA